jgi:hypothetical protein
VLFAFASVAEIIYGKAISDKECTALYHQVLKDLKRPSGAGMTFPEGWRYAKRWFPDGKAIKQQSSLSAIVRGPLLAGYQVTPAFDRTNPVGCLDHATRGPSRGGHAVALPAVAALPKQPSLGRCVWVENSWRGWGWRGRGIGVMTEVLHRSLCNQVWEVVR